MSLVSLAPYCLPADQQPAARIDLRPYGYEEEPWGDTAVRFSGRFLLVYAGRYYTSSMRLKLAVNQETLQPVPEKELASLSLPPWEEPPAKTDAGLSI